MAEENVNPVIFTWTIKIATAIMTFMTGIIVYLHRKVHEMDKAFSINEERDVLREKILARVETKVNSMDIKLNKALDMFREQQLELNRTEKEREEFAILIVEQKETIENIRKVRKM